MIPKSTFKKKVIPSAEDAAKLDALRAVFPDMSFKVKSAKPNGTHKPIRILHGDCLEVLATLPADSIDAIVTDPPYHLGPLQGRSSRAPEGMYRTMRTGFMNKQWDGGDVAFRPETWAAVLRVLKPGGYMVCFASTRGYHRMVCAIEDAGFIIHPMLGWIFGSGFPKATNLSKQLDKAEGAVREVISHLSSDGVQRAPRETQPGGGNRKDTYVPTQTAPATPEAKQWEGWGYGLQSLKPALEPICMAQKPAIREGMVANVRKYDTGAINIDKCRVPSGKDHADKCASVVGLNSNRNGNCFGEWNGVRTDSYDAAGRWPANVIHDGSPEVMDAFAAFGENTSRAGRSINPQSKQDTTISFNGKAVAIPGVNTHNDTGTASRFFFCAKASKQDRVGSKHPTIKPVSLIRYLCRLITPPNGTILDPFAGSGTTGEAALREGFNALLIEQDQQSIKDSKWRSRVVQGVTAPWWGYED